MSKPDRLALQLAPDRIGLLLATEQPRRNAGRLQLVRYFSADHSHGLALLDAKRLQAAQDGRAPNRVEVGKAQLLQLATDRVAADIACERGIDVQRLTGDALALGRALDVLQRAHIVQAVGQFNQQHPHILADSQDELA